MSDEATWIAEQANKAKKTHPVPDSVSTRMVELLKGQLSERQLTPKEMSAVTELLIKDMATLNKPSSEEKP